MKKLILNIDLLKSTLKQQSQVVFTNGCFDIIHAGHVDYLQKAKAKGEVLVVAVNSDASVKKLKGANRPVFSLKERLTVLNAIEYIDYLTVFDEDTPLILIQQLLPDVLVKGSDYKKEDIVGYSDVINNGGKVETVDFIFDSSTSETITKLKLN